MQSRHFKSRKFTFAVLGTCAVLAVFATSMVTMVLCPAIAPQIVNLANIAIVFLGSVTGVMVGGQSFVDWKHGSASQFNDINDTANITEDRRENSDERISTIEKIERPRDYDSADVP